MSEVKERAPDAINALRSELHACQSESKARSEEMQVEISRLEGEVIACKSAKEWSESESAKRMRTAEDSARATINGLMAQLKDAKAALASERAKYVECGAHAIRSNTN